MILTDLSVRRPVFATVISLLIVAFGLVAFGKLPLREYPAIDAPVVSVDTRYRGASAAVVERRITKPLEDRIAGIEGIRNVVSESRDGRSTITIEFSLDRDIDAASNDVRERVSRELGNLPDEADPPEISKASSDDDTIMWLNLVSDRMSMLELSDYANRYLADRFSALDGVARVRIGGGLDYAIRIWLDRSALAARQLTAADVEDALRRENVELPAGNIESDARQFTVRIQRAYPKAEDFQAIVVGRGSDGHLIRLADVARVELAAAETRIAFNGNGVPMVGIGITRQSTANTLEVARGARALAEAIAPTLPVGMELLTSYDSSVFIEASIKEVYLTLGIAMVLVVVVIFLFLGNVRATLIPAVTVPVSLLGTFIILFALGYTLNLLTLLALILAIGLVVDDAIVMLENIHRRIEAGESPLVAAFRGGRQVAFAVVATTLVLISVFLPITFLEGDVGRLFREFAVAMSAAVGFSSIVALTLSPMMCANLLTNHDRINPVTRAMDRGLDRLRQAYIRLLRGSVERPGAAIVLVAGALALSVWLFKLIPEEFAPPEDRGAFFVTVTAPEGSSYSYSKSYMDEIERRLMPLVESGEVKRLLVRTPRSFGSTSDFSGGFVIMVLEDWGQRRDAWAIMADVRKRLGDLAGVRAFPVMRQGLGGGFGKPVQFVLGGADYAELAEWRDIMLAEAAKNPGLIGVDHDYKESKPQLRVMVDTQRAGDLGVSVQEVGQTLETMLGSRVVTTYQQRGEEYDVIVEGERLSHNTPADLNNIQVRGRDNQLVPLSAVVKVEEVADADALMRYNRMRAVTIDANLADGYTLGEALNYLEQVAADKLPASVVIGYKGQSLDLRESSASIHFALVLALIVVFLVLAAQFESYIHPLVIMLSVPLAVLGALVGLALANQSLNIYSQIGIIMLIGLAAKNGILIVEFANQLRDEGMAFADALIEAAGQRLRPILMTGLTTAFGAVPLVITSGAGAETRYVLGVVILVGCLMAILFTLYVIPVMYALLARNTRSPEAVSQELARELAAHDEQR